MKSFLENNSLVLISTYFGNSFSKSFLGDNYIYYTEYSLDYNKINIILKDGTLSFISNDNVLSLKGNKQEELININGINLENDNNNIYENLSISIQLYIEYQSLKKKMNGQFAYSSDETNYYYYLINKNYINELCSIFVWKEIFNILNIHIELFDNLKNRFFDKEKVNEIKKYLSKETNGFFINKINK